jgi:hypothetical protein
MEAENANSNATTDGIHNWESSTSTSGVTYYQAMPSDGEDCETNGDNCGALLTFSMQINKADTYTPYFRVMLSAAANKLLWGIDGVTKERISGGTHGSWYWMAGSSVYLAPGDRVLEIWMAEAGVMLDRIVLTTGSAPALSEVGPAQVCEEICPTPACTTSCTDSCVSVGSEWPECGVGQGKECCGSPGMAYCAPLGQCSSVQPEPQLGETWSAPVAGRVKFSDGSSQWVVFFASGYNNIGQPNVGRALWALDANTGNLLGKWNTDDIEYSVNNPSTIVNALPASPSLVDVNGDGYVDRAYYADLEGRIWRLSMPTSATAVSNWTTTKIFDAGQPDHSTSTRIWAPIITKPGLAVFSGGNVNLYFGTGGDEEAPPTSTYYFYGIRDTGESTTRYPDQLDSAKLEWKITAPSGHKYWADPMIANSAVVYFASLPGNIESVNPFLSLEGSSKLYGIAIRNYIDKSGAARQLGQSVYDTDYLEASSKVRQMMILRGTPQQPWVKPEAYVTVASTDVLLQEFAGESASDRPAIRRITDKGVTASATKLKVINWREVPRGQWAP